jgi:hypothetical protein
MLGFSCKPGVGDIRESPALEILTLLSALGADVRYHDPSRQRAQVDIASRRYRGAPTGDQARYAHHAPRRGKDAPPPRAPIPTGLRGCDPKTHAPAHHALPAPNHTPYRSAPGSHKRSASSTRTVGDRRRKRSAHDPARTCAERSCARFHQTGDKVCGAPGASTRSSARCSRSTAPRRNTGIPGCASRSIAPREKTLQEENISFPQDSLRLVAAA